MIALIDYGMGNLFSVRKALEAVGAGEIRVVDAPGPVADADALVLPGVGNFGDGARRLAVKGLDRAIVAAAKNGKPLFGICLGLQLLMDSSEEAPGVPGLGLIRGTCRRFSDDSGLKVPQIGWNSVRIRRPHVCLGDCRDGEYFYFVHSYHAVPADPEWVVGVSEYGETFCACAGKDRVFAAQFHPEKSQDAGLALLRNFVRTVNA